MHKKFTNDIEKRNQIRYNNCRKNTKTRETFVLNEKEIRTQAKIFILYILGNIGEAVEFTTLNDMVLQDGLVTYFDFAAAFSDLLDKEQVAAYTVTKEGEPLYTVTEEGRSVLETYQHEMSSAVRDRAVRHAMRVLAFERDGVRQHSSIEETGTGWTLTCSISDREKQLFRTSVFLSNREYAEQLRDNFDDRADIIYRGVLSLLSGDVNFIFD